MRVLQPNASQAMAGLNAFSHVSSFASALGYVSVGALANWWSKYFGAVTHWLWDRFFDLVPWLHIKLTSPEKDSLTTIVFFAPVFVLSVIRLKSNLRWSSGSPMASIGIMALSLLASGFLIFLCSRSTFIDVFTLTSTPVLVQWLGMSHAAYWTAFDIALGANILFIIVLCVIYALPQQYAASHRKMIDRIMLDVLIVGGAVSLCILACPILDILVRAFGDSGKLGPVRTVAVPVIIALVLGTNMINPKVIVRIGAVVVLLALLSIGWSWLIGLKAVIEAQAG